MKKLVSIILAAALAFSLAACGGGSDSSSSASQSASQAADSVASKAEDGKALKIGFALPTLQFPFYVRMHDAFVEECEKRGWEVVFVDGNLDSLTEVNGCLDLISKNVDALVFATWWMDAMVDVFDLAAKSDIPVYMMDGVTTPDGVEYVSITGTDNYDAGKVGGTWMAGQLKAEGKTSVNLINITMASESAVDRCNGFMDGMKENGIEVNLVNDYIGDTRAKSMQAAEDALVTYGEGKVDLIFGYSAQSSLGAYDAVVAANRSEIKVMGFDGEQDELDLIDAGTQYVGTIIQYPDKMGVLTAELIEKTLIGGETVEQKQPMSAGVYCADGALSGEEIMGK